ncbi:hypothetical protein [Ralstonia sp. SET104]|uniref:hypothetical protein n=1 Tax=Ralstonia sp. SET104 TaxID=2448774 RepID=UPI000F5709E8|nr:hypothetical protein [Ralstonia sp. SET104]GCB02935.1 hypothetical protein PSUB009319_05660 [Ralstonia sp. SET104]
MTNPVIIGQIFTVSNADGTEFGRGCFSYRGTPGAVTLSHPSDGAAGSVKVENFWYHDSVVGTLGPLDLKALTFSTDGTARFSFEAERAGQIGIAVEVVSKERAGNVSAHRGAAGDFTNQGRTVAFPRENIVPEGELIVPAVDLVVLIDTSYSMLDEAQCLSDAVELAIETAKSTCPSDLRVTYLGVEGWFKDDKKGTYLGTSKVKAAERKKLESELARVASGTGGQSFTDKDALGGFQALLEKVICGSRTTPGSAEDVPCKDCDKPETPPKKEPPAAKEPPVAPPPEKKEPISVNDDLYAIVLSDPIWWAANNYDDNSDIYIHEAKTGAVKRKVVDNSSAMGQSNAITSDGWHYYVQNNTDVVRMREGGAPQKLSSLSKPAGWAYIDGFAFRQDNMGFMLHTQSPSIAYFKHDPSPNAQIQPGRLTVRLEGGGPVPFGKGDAQFVADLVFDGNDRAYFIAALGDIWVVEDTRSLTEWKARHLYRVPPVQLPGHTRYIGIAFDAQGTVYLCGGVVETEQPPRQGLGRFAKYGSRWSRRFISRFRLDNPGSMELVYDGGPRSGSYGDLASLAFPKITKV